jgi:hypothetical protein
MALFCTTLLLEVLILSQSSVQARLIQPAARAQQLTAITALGASMNSNSATDLCTSGQNIPSINKEMWIFFRLNSPSLPNLWIEAGAKDGAVATSLADQINQRYWKGNFIGYNLAEEQDVNQSQTVRFFNFAFGGVNPTGINNYEIKIIDSGFQPTTGKLITTWAVFYNGARIFTIPRKPQYAASSGVQVGVENKDDTNSFKSPTTITNWRYLQPNGALPTLTGTSTLIPSASNQDVNASYGLGYRSSFSATSTNNTVTLSTTKSCPVVRSLSRTRNLRRNINLSLSRTKVWKPTLKANRDMRKTRFQTREQAIGTLPEGARLISAKKMAWKAYEDSELRGANFADIAKERVVWVVKVAFSKDYETENGIYEKPIFTTVTDAETGRFITQNIAGKLKKDYRFQGLPTLEAPSFTRDNIER